MRIVIIGAPFSGKSALAKAIAKKLPGRSAIVDGYIEKLARETDETYGVIANYGMNLQAAAARLTAEKVAKVKDTDHIIVCGSVIESLVYNGLRVNRDLFANKDDEELQKVLLTFGEGASMGLGVIVATVMDPQELVLFLPLSEKVKEEHGGRSYEIAIDKMLPEAISSLNRPHITLTGTPREKAKQAIHVINEYQQYLDEREAEVAALAQGSGTNAG